MKNVIRGCVMLLLPVIAAAYLLYSLETYGHVVHSDASTAVSLLALICAFIEFKIWRKVRKQHKAFTVIAIFTAVVLIGVMYVAGKIPFCVECDQVTADDLGFLTHWITPLESYNILTSDSSCFSGQFWENLPASLGLTNLQYTTDYRFAFYDQDSGLFICYDETM